MDFSTNPLVSVYRKGRSFASISRRVPQIFGGFPWKKRPIVVQPAARHNRPAKPGSQFRQCVHGVRVGRCLVVIRGRRYCCQVAATA